jgi:hypothetical protein
MKLSGERSCNFIKVYTFEVNNKMEHILGIMSVRTIIQYSITLLIPYNTVFSFQNSNHKVPLAFQNLYQVSAYKFWLWVPYAGGFNQISELFHVQGTADEVVDCSHGRALWELSKVKYEPLWVKGGNHCNLELYPEYIKHLKKFVNAIERSPPVKDESPESSDPSDPSETGSESAESSRRSTDIRDKPRSSIDHRPSIDRREKPRGSIDRRDKSRKSVDQLDKPRASVDQPDRPRKSIDRFVYTFLWFLLYIPLWNFVVTRILFPALLTLVMPRCDSFGGMMRSVKLCNIDCFTAASGS